MNNQNFFRTRVTATGVVIPVAVGFVPRKVVISNLGVVTPYASIAANNYSLTWTDDMAPGCFSLQDAAGTRVFQTRRKIVIPASGTPGRAAALTLVTGTAGSEAVIAGETYINYAIVDGGTSTGTAIVETGTGTSADPILYTITAHDDDNDNDTIIAAITALTGEIIAATGTSDATALLDPPTVASQAIPPAGITPLDVGIEGYDDNVLGILISDIPNINDTTTEQLLIEAWR